ncbi:L-asparaginase [Metschnikowia bicuspidata var. bicuspidata NRRL YB-4993]|uniref:asparaginase n=1 Tax=Metschnikowia bicuspidata var. bicuspidata NRRL YB-4993 TaxID=869754 RepID=A0A1A0H7G2_9ASCO|nr:L-asparaginase [Metschnikowia bicuspidata var. bicuspidata NRRL YB-4993]OBA20034.1 L-asparaginase [Metschnikowia bicuspidata var. bicuspidata NRRL YB-4993]
MSLQNIDETFEIQEDNSDRFHPVFTVRYRQNSISTIDSIPSVGSQKLPIIKILGTGGTIASKGALEIPQPGYHVDLTIEDLMASVPDLTHTCELEFEQVFNIDSKEITTKHLLHLRSKVQESIQNFDGVVITHGTDTFEETAFFLDSTVDFMDKPVVMCGSMRPLTSVSADGPSNLYQACVVASDKQSRGRGVLVTLNDKIGSGYYISKTDANSLDTFKSLGHGYLGNFVAGEAHYYFPALKPSGLRNFQLPAFYNGCLPEVAIFYAHQNFNNDLILLAVEHMQLQGIVMATMGAGSLSDLTNKLLGEISSEHQLPVIYSKRSTDGMIPVSGLPKNDNTYLVASGYLNPPKARILLQLCLFEKMDIRQIKRVFSGVYGG